MKKSIALLLMFVVLSFGLTGCSGSSGNARTTEYEAPRVADYQDVFYTPWPSELKNKLKEEAGNTAAQKPYTLMVYINGSDLESDGSGNATADIQEMLDSGFDPEKVNVVLYAGGTLDWDSGAIDWAKDDPASLPDGTSGIFTIVREGSSNKLKTVNYDIAESNKGTSLPMMDGGTMSGFIDYTKEVFPATNYSFLFWNHGSGSLIGYGYDELLDESDPRTSMNLLTIQKAFTEGKTNFDFVGFDTCLMSNLETALAVKGNAKTLVASQELEPGYGWDYRWLKELSDNPSKDSKEIGKKIVDYFNEYYRENITAIGSSLSVTDLSKIDAVMNAVSGLSTAASNDLPTGKFSTIAKARDKTETFGSSDVKSEKYQYMADIGDMGKELKDTYPAEVQNLESALSQAVVYNKTTDFNSDKERKNTTGLSIYYPYAFDSDEEQYLFNAMRNLGISDAYANYLNSYSDVFYGGSGNVEIEAQMQQSINNAPIQEDASGDIFIQLSKEEMKDMRSIYFNVWQPVDEKGMEDYYFSYLEEGNVEIDNNGKILTEFNGVLPMLGDDYICLYEIERTDEQTIYSSPAMLNGEEVNLLIAINDQYPDGKILGAQPATDENSGVPSRKITELKKGDKVVLEYYAEYLGEDPNKESMWYEGEEITIGKEAKIEWVDVPVNETFMYGYSIQDVYDNIYYTDYIEIEFSE